ncbi:hypothetical protein [Acinetobacter sp. MD2]|uniref:hypothetical protein n=1 Tax=Acinetobacter sp. MD2 TaxID=2600066 RepID=UPI002D1EFDDE|nr:hypothetical protein [Acinetobacter sp. MD2]MEB3767431.1 hypothetical protein [Acinetobacter sp. MD2]
MAMVINLLQFKETTFGWFFVALELNEQQLFKAKVQHVLMFAKNQYYAPIWIPQLKQENWILLKAIGNSFNLYDEYNNIAKLLKII